MVQLLELHVFVFFDEESNDKGTRDMEMAIVNWAMLLQFGRVV